MSNQHDVRSLNLVNSSRLKALRERSATPNAEPAIADNPTNLDDLQRFIASHIAQILASMPTGRQKSLFKIRYGLTPEDLQRQPAKQVAEILGIHLPSDVKSPKWHKKTK